MKLIVDKAQRSAKKRAHTATHLLHAELAIFFPHTKQAGSFVDKDITRFDFHAKEQLSQIQIEEIENNINQTIEEGKEVNTAEYNYQEALKMWAKAFFWDKYGDTVRVVSIQWDHEKKYCSIELCWWTHVINTSQIWSFKIVSQEAVAAGIKRLTALTGPKVAKYAQEKESELWNIGNLLNVQPAQVYQKLEKEISEKESLRKKLESLQTKLLNSELQKLATPHNQEQVDYTVNIPDNLLTIGFKNIVNEAKQIFNEKNVILRTSSAQYAILGQNGLDAKWYAQSLGLKGGWSDFLFQGKDPKVNEL